MPHKRAKASTSRNPPITVVPETTAFESGSTPPQGSHEDSPTDIYNASRFHNYEASKFFLDSYMQKSIVMERRVDFESLAKAHPRVREVFALLGWAEMLSIADKVSATLVREFYASMHSYKDGTFMTML